MPIINCETLAKTKALAIKRGLNADLINCPFVETRNNCTGKICIYRAALKREHGSVNVEDSFDQERVEELEDRIEDCIPDDITRLTRLREELREISLHTYTDR